MSDLDTLLSLVEEAAIAAYQSPAAVEQRLLFGCNVFRVGEDGTVQVVPHEEWPDTRRPT